MARRMNQAPMGGMNNPVDISRNTIDTQRELSFQKIFNALWGGYDLEHNRRVSIWGAVKNSESKADKKWKRHAQSIEDYNLSSVASADHNVIQRLYGPIAGWHESDDTRVKFSHMRKIYTFSPMARGMFWLIVGAIAAITTYVAAAINGYGGSMGLIALFILVTPALVAWVQQRWYPTRRNQIEFQEYVRKRRASLALYNSGIITRDSREIGYQPKIDMVFGGIDFANPENLYERESLVVAKYKPEAVVLSYLVPATKTSSEFVSAHESIRINMGYKTLRHLPAKVDVMQNTRARVNFMAMNMSLAAVDTNFNMKLINGKYKDPKKIVLGYDDLGQEVSVDFTESRMLLAGESGSGKTALIYAITMQLIATGYDVYAVDLKSGVGLRPYLNAGGGGLRAAGSTLEDLDVIAYRLAEEVQYRAAHPHLIQKLRPIVLLIDEVNFLALNGSVTRDAYAPIKASIMESLRLIATQGREPQVSLILAGQHLSAEAISTAIRGQLGVRVLLQTSEESAQNMVMPSRPESIAKDFQDVMTGSRDANGKRIMGRGFATVNGPPVLFRTMKLETKPGMNKVLPSTLPPEQITRPAYKILPQHEMLVATALTDSFEDSIELEDSSLAQKPILMAKNAVRVPYSGIPMRTNITPEQMEKLLKSNTEQEIAEAKRAQAAIMQSVSNLDATDVEEYSDSWSIKIPSLDKPAVIPEYETLELDKPKKQKPTPSTFYEIPQEAPVEVALQPKPTRPKPKRMDLRMGRSEEQLRELNDVQNFNSMSKYLLDLDYTYVPSPGNNVDAEGWNTWVIEQYRNRGIAAAEIVGKSRKMTPVMVYEGHQYPAERQLPIRNNARIYPDAPPREFNPDYEVPRVHLYKVETEVETGEYITEATIAKEKAIAASVIEDNEVVTPTPMNPGAEELANQLVDESGDFTEFGAFSGILAIAKDQVDRISQKKGAPAIPMQQAQPAVPATGSTPTDFGLPSRPESDKEVSSSPQSTQEPEEEEDFELRALSDSRFLAGDDDLDPAVLAEMKAQRNATYNPEDAW